LKTGRPKKTTERVRRAVLRLSWHTILRYMKDEKVSMREKIRVAEKLASKDIPADVKIEGDRQVTPIVIHMPENYQIKALERRKYIPESISG